MRRKRGRAAQVVVRITTLPASPDFRQSPGPATAMIFMRKASFGRLLRLPGSGSGPCLLRRPRPARNRRGQQGRQPRPLHVLIFALNRYGHQLEHFSRSVSGTFRLSALEVQDFIHQWNRTDSRLEADLRRDHRAAPGCKAVTRQNPRATSGTERPANACGSHPLSWAGRPSAAKAPDVGRDHAA